MNGSVRCRSRPSAINPEDGGLIAPQHHLMRLESPVSDADLDWSGRRPIDRLDNRWIVHADRAESSDPHPVANGVSSKGALPFKP